MELLRRYLRWSTLLPQAGRIFHNGHTPKLHIAQFIPLVIIVGTLGCVCIVPLGAIQVLPTVLMTAVAWLLLCVVLGRFQQGMLIAYLVVAFQVGLLLDVYWNTYLQSHSGQFTLAFLVYLILATIGIFLGGRSVVMLPTGCGIALLLLTRLRASTWQDVFALAVPPLAYMCFITTLVIR